eukprot:CAMPEP_0202362012 /NCGR_PEP_ID=MMETSP1126-20121109/14346_1 /ASSEMBLY_ACC=CAM_ASM_000457 /TAXON_ID=3047 /ORGANISM="Dunaliella tertiolecta, Strain CCMP1320" /LENGTH=137 /DNA_ID=CAMNT_0048956081 /DNA_START=75 /DNA_END=488 /DNA_ORIENTATION=-
MYGLLSIADLEQDFINPYDLSKKLNSFVMVEYGAQLLMTVVLVLGGRWFIGLVQVGLSAYMVWLYVNKKYLLDATDAFKEAKSHKNRRTIIFGVHAFSMIFLVYMLIHTFVHTVLSSGARETAKQLFKEAATSVHGF